MNLPLNNLQSLICHKNPTNNYLQLAGGRIVGFIMFLEGISTKENAVSIIQDLNNNNDCTMRHLVGMQGNNLILLICFLHTSWSQENPKILSCPRSGIVSKALDSNIIVNEFKFEP